MFDWGTDGKPQAVKGITSVKYDPKKGYTAEALSMEIDNDTFDEYNAMVKDMGLLEGLTEKYGEGGSTMLPKKASAYFSREQETNRRFGYGKVFNHANELGSDASDDPQMAMFVAQALQFSKDAKALPAASAQQQQENIAQAKEMILDMAKDFIDMRNVRKNAEWAAWAKAKGKRSTGGKAMAFLGLSDTEWKNPVTGKEESGAPVNDPVLEWSMGSPARDIEQRKAGSVPYRTQVQGIRN